MAQSIVSGYLKGQFNGTEVTRAAMCSPLSERPAGARVDVLFSISTNARGTYTAITSYSSFNLNAFFMALNVTDKGSPKLPQELIDTILDNLFNDSEALKQCRLVSKSFLSTSQRLLWSRFTISDSAAENFLDSNKLSISSRVADLLDAYTTDLTFLENRKWKSHPNFPNFPRVERIIFKGEMFKINTPGQDFFQLIKISGALNSTSISRTTSIL